MSSSYTIIRVHTTIIRVHTTIIRVHTNCNSLKNAINNSNLDTSGIKPIIFLFSKNTKKLKNWYVNICLSSPRQQCSSPSQTIYANNIKKSFSSKKYKYINLKKIEEELVELKQKNSEKEKIIINLESQITQLKNENAKFLNSKKEFENEINKLREEINFKNKENEKLSLKLNEEKKTNKEYIDKLKEIKRLKDKYIIKLQYEKEQNIILKKMLNENENKILNKNDKNNPEKSFDKNTKRSLEINGLKDISNISGIDNKINMEQNEQEDMTLKEIIQDKLLDIVDKKWDSSEIYMKKFYI